MLRSIIFWLGVSSIANGHFILNYPPTLGFEDALEGTAPCGSFVVKFSSDDVSLPVGEFPVSVRSIHPQAAWLFRATLSKTAPFNWTNLLPVVDQTGLGDFCLPNLQAPADFAGSEGVLQVIQNAIDGTSYQVTLEHRHVETLFANFISQCSAVKFITGMNTTAGSGCNNVTGLTATITNQQSFGSGSATMRSSPAATSTAAAAREYGNSGLGLGFAPGLGILLAGMVAL